jgi:DmsE family decaheme c-type cytochrome
MKQQRQNVKLAIILIFGLILTIFILGERATSQVITGPAPQGRAMPSVAPSLAKSRHPQEKQEKESQYVGADTCKLCHEDTYNHFAKTAHFLTVTSSKYGEANKGCEACHGPGKEHVDGGGDATKIYNFKNRATSEMNGRCLTCHERQEERHNFQQSEHGLNQVACTDCHSSHQPELIENLLIKRTPTLCYQCHGEIKQEFSKPFHHRVPEGGMKCTTCHNQHGGFNVTQTREASGGTDPICLKCHTDKQGPFVFEHAPVKLEGCTVCHVPHGSNNPKLHKRPVVQLLCLECHADTPGIMGPEPPAFHDIRNPRYQNCTTCHVKIHGSNVNRFFFQ